MSSITEEQIKSLNTTLSKFIVIVYILVMLTQFCFYSFVDEALILSVLL